VRGMDPRIRIHTKMSWIRNTAFNEWHVLQTPPALDSRGGGEEEGGTKPEGEGGGEKPDLSGAESTALLKAGGVKRERLEPDIKPDIKRMKLEK
jgi:hypothetical protein